MKIGGKEISNWWLIGGGAGVIGLWLLYRHSSSSSANTASSGSGIDPVTGLPYSEDQQVDPETGMTYLAEAQEYGSVSAAEAAVSSGSGYDDTGYGSDSGYVGTAGYPTENVGTGTSTTGSYATNAAWAQAVTAGLVALGYSSTDVAAALGLFFAGQPLGNGSDGVSYASIVQAAEAEYGPPPQGTYSIIAEPSTGTGGAGSGGTTTTSTGTGTTTTSTTTTGGPITAVPSNFRVTGVNGLKISLAWDAVQVPAGQGPLAGYTVAYGQSPTDTPYEVAVGAGTTTATITFNSGPGSEGLTHYFVVWARPASPGGPHAGPISAKTQ
jgi:hypothetical protein